MCDWSEAQLEENIRDKIVMGLWNECLLQQLLTQDHKKLLEELLEVARVFEAAEHKSFKHVDLEKKTDNAVAKAKAQKLTGGTRETRKQTQRPSVSNQQATRYLLFPQFQMQKVQ